MTDEILENKNMCGIIYAKSKKGKPVKNIVWQKYLGQKHRGDEGFGFVAIKDGIATIYKAEKEKTIKDLIGRVDADEILFHHRYPTSTPNIVQATHPIEVHLRKAKYKYCVVHNGVIS